MQRTPEPELMDGAEQALAYARGDFAEVNAAFVERFVATFPELEAGACIDLGCGPAQICVGLARAVPGLRLTGVDGAAAMLVHAREAVAGAGLGERITLVESTLPSAPGVLPEGHFDAVISNSLLHHLHEPRVLWRELLRVARPGAAVLVVDLLRSSDDAAARRIVDTWMPHEPPVLRRDFLASLHAAFRPDEVRAQLAEHAALRDLRVEVISDRHLCVSGRVATR